MVSVSTTEERWGVLTRADLDALAAQLDDGRRYELLDGSIVVTPSPGSRHQVLVTAVWSVLAAAATEGHRAFVAPLDVELGPGDVLEPDVFVVRRDQVRENDVAGAPLLVVEILSPSTRRRDLGDKLTAYRDAGVPHYWVLDPRGPRLVAHDLVDGEYVVVADVTGGESWTTAAPFPLTITPADLLR